MALLVLILGLVWAGALAPMLIRKIAEYRLDTSLARFRQSALFLRNTHSVLSASVERSDEPIVPSVVSTKGAATRTKVDRARSRRRIERRIRVFRSLGIAIAAPLLIGALPALRVLWYCSLAAAVIAGLYVALLIVVRRQEMLKLERDRKVVVLTRPSPATNYLQPLALVASAAGARAMSSARSGSAEFERRPTFRIVELPS